MNGKITVLLVESDPQVTQLLLLLMTAPAWPPLPFTLVCVEGLDSARAALAKDATIQVVLLDANHSGCGPLEALRAIQSHSPSVPIVLLTEDGGDSVGLMAVAAGAQDYQIKSNLDARTLKRTLSCAIVRRIAGAARTRKQRHAHA